MTNYFTPARILAVAVLGVIAVALTGATAGSLLADNGSLPWVQTGVVANTTASSATILGTVGANNYTTSYFVEYGTTNTLGSASPSQTIGSATAQSVSVVITGLSANTTYYFRLVAQNSNGTSRGDIATFTTGTGNGGVGSAVTTNPVINPGWNSATLNGYVLDPGGNGGSAYFLYGTDRDNLSGTTASASIQGISYYRTTAFVTPMYTIAVSNLSGGTTYYFRAAFRDTQGVLSLGPVLSFTTASTPQGAVGNGGVISSSDPNAPDITQTNLDGASATGAAIGASVNSKGYATAVWFEYGTTQSFGQKTPAKSAGAATFAAPVTDSLTGLIPNVKYWLRPVAQNQYGMTYGSALSFTTPGNIVGGDVEPVIIAAQEPRIVRVSVPANCPTQNVVQQIPSQPVTLNSAPLNTTAQGNNTLASQGASVSNSVKISGAAVVNFILLLIVVGLLIWVLTRPNPDYE